MGKTTNTAKALVCLLALMGGSAAAQAQSSCGTFSHVEGDVKFVPKKSTTQWIAAETGQSICAGGSIATASNGRATVQFSGGEQLHISPSTRLLVAALNTGPKAEKKKALMNLINGKVRANIPPGSYKTTESQFRIRSETAVAGVRGTQFVMSYSQKTRTSEVVTLSGQVEVGQPTGRGFGFINSVMVRPGQKTTATPTAPPAPPIDLPVEEIQGVDEGSSAAAAPEASSSPEADPPEGSQASHSETPREPASTLPSMVSAEDLAAPPEGLIGPSDLMLHDPIHNQLPPPVICDFCEDRISEGPARLKIRVRRGN